MVGLLPRAAQPSLQVAGQMRPGPVQGQVQPLRRCPCPGAVDRERGTLQLKSALTRPGQGCRRTC